MFRWKQNELCIGLIQGTLCCLLLRNKRLFKVNCCLLLDIQVLQNCQLFLIFNQTVFHESPCAMSQPQESPRSSRSNSLKPQSQIFLFPSRPKRRTLSLPSKPIIPPHIIIQGCHNNNDTQSEEEEKERSEVKKENMAWYTPLVGLSCSLAVYFLACALTYYSSR